LASPKWSKHLKTPTSSLKCGDMIGSTSIDKKSKDKDFVANEVSESNYESNEVITRYTTNKETIQNSSFFFGIHIVS
jgi:hypothetical protein